MIGAGVQAECFGTPVLRRVEHGPALQQHRRRAGAHPRRRRRRSSIASPDTISAYADGGVVKLGADEGRPGQDLPDRTCRSPTPTSQLLQMYQFAGDGGGIILDFTPDTAPAVHEGGDRPGHRRQGEVGLVDADREHVHGRASSPQFDGHLWINQEFANLDPSDGPDTRADVRRS